MLFAPLAHNHANLREAESKAGFITELPSWACLAGLPMVAATYQNIWLVAVLLIASGLLAGRASLGEDFGLSRFIVGFSAGVFAMTEVGGWAVPDFGRYTDYWSAKIGFPAFWQLLLLGMGSAIVLSGLGLALRKGFPSPPSTELASTKNRSALTPIVLPAELLAIAIRWLLYTIYCLGLILVRAGAGSIEALVSILLDWSTTSRLLAVLILSVGSFVLAGVGVEYQVDLALFTYVTEARTANWTDSTSLFALVSFSGALITLWLISLLLSDVDKPEGLLFVPRIGSYLGTSLLFSAVILTVVGGTLTSDGLAGFTFEWPEIAGPIAMALAAPLVAGAAVSLRFAGTEGDPAHAMLQTAKFVLPAAAVVVGIIVAVASPG